jgi:hypothetical protein
VLHDALAAATSDTYVVGVDLGYDVLDVSAVQESLLPQRLLELLLGNATAATDDDKGS